MIVCLDEFFKSNSAILNALLTLLNERRYTSGGVVMKCPLLSCFGASNEVPTDETLTAIFDRFLLRIRSDNLDAYHFQDLLTKGVQHEIHSLTDAPVQPLASAKEIQELHRAFAQRMRFTEEFFSQHKGLNEIKAALGASPDPRAPELVQRVDQLLEAAFRSGRFAQL